MFSKKILSTVAILFAYGLNAVKAVPKPVEFPPCGGITFNSVKEITDQTSLETFIGNTNLLNCIDEDGIVYAYDGSTEEYVKGYVKSIDTSNPNPTYEDDLTYGSFTELVKGFNILDIEGNNVSKIEDFTYYEGYVSQGDTLAILKCDQEEDGSLKCKQTYGYIQSVDNYYHIGSDSSKIIEVDESKCNEGNIGMLEMWDSTGICIESDNEDNKIGFLTGAAENKKYLLFGTTAVNSESPFQGLNIGDENDGIVIVAQSSTVDDDSGKLLIPSMVVFDPTYDVTNDCFISDDNSITDRIENLCGGASDCSDYYYCQEGICTKSNSVAPAKKQLSDSGNGGPGPVEPSCIPTSTTPEEIAACQGFQPYSGGFYNCDGVSVCNPLTKPGYFTDKYDSEKYIKCTMVSGNLVCTEEGVINTESGVNCSGNVGKLINDGSSGIQLCLESDKPLTLSSAEGNYFISVASYNIFGETMPSHYISVTVEGEDVTQTVYSTTDEVYDNDKWYQFAAKGNNKIYERGTTGLHENENLCADKSRISQYQIQSNDESHLNVANSPYYKKVVVA